MFASIVQKLPNLATNCKNKHKYGTYMAHKEEFELVTPQDVEHLNLKKLTMETNFAGETEDGKLK